MLHGHPQIVLVHPEIPQNTGAIARLAAGSGARLHLVKPLGFSLDEKQMRRAGLDYWPFLDLEIHEDLDSVLALTRGKFAMLSKFGKKNYTQIPAEVDFLIFGCETKGLPPEVREKHADHLYGIPMFHPGVRSLNLANAVSVVVYDRLMRTVCTRK